MISNPKVNLIITGGASGVGKSTYLREVAAQSGVTLINFGEEIHNTALDINNKSYPELIERQKKFIRELAGMRFITRMMQLSGTVLVDGHFVDKQVSILQQGMPDFFWHEFDKYMLLSAEPMEIRRRRINDSRRRSPNLAEITSETESEERVMRELALHFGKPFEVIDLGKPQHELTYDIALDRGATFPITRYSKER